MTVRAGYLRDEDHGFESVVLLDEESQDSIEIQQSLEFNDQDRATGMDTYCVGRSGAASSYGGITSWHADAGSLTFEFAPDAAQVLEIPTVVTPEVGADQLRPIISVLHRLLG